MAAEVRLDRMIRGGKEMRPKMNKYRRLLLETQAIKDKYTMGYFRTLKEYIVAVGHKVIRTQEELHKTVMENEEEQADVVQEMIEAGAAEDNEEEEQLHEEQVDSSRSDAKRNRGGKYSQEKLRCVSKEN